MDERENLIVQTQPSERQNLLFTRGQPEGAEERYLQAKTNQTVQQTVPGHVQTRIHSFKKGGRPLAKGGRNYFETRMGYDFGDVRIHYDEVAHEAAQAINANAFTIGRHIVFGPGQYAPRTEVGKKLLAHELTHVIQQQEPREALSRVGAKNVPSAPGTAAVTHDKDLAIRRDPVFPDVTCTPVQDNIRPAWPTAKSWVQLARRRLAEPTRVASALQLHFKIDPNDEAHAGDLGTVRDVFREMERLFDTNIDNRCTPANADDECRLPDGRKYAAYVHAGTPNDGITHCLPSADVGFLSRRPLIDTLVHEMAHLADPLSTDYAYRDEAVVTTYENMTRAQAIRNGDSYSEFARDMFSGPSRLPLMLGLSTGVLLSSGRPRWAIAASYDVRLSSTGIEVFDLVGGLHGFIALDIGAGEGEPVLRDVGGAVDFGVISRSAETRFFADSRLGAFYTTDVAGTEPDRAGLTVNAMLGWADSGFRVGVNMRLLYDFLQRNHAVIIGGEFSWGP